MSDVFVKALDPFLRSGYANPQKLKGHVHVTFQLCGVPFFKPIGRTSLPPYERKSIKKRTYDLTKIRCGTKCLFFLTSRTYVILIFLFR